MPTVTVEETTVQEGAVLASIRSPNISSVRTSSVELDVVDEGAPARASPIKKLRLGANHNLTHSRLSRPSMEGRPSMLGRFGLSMRHSFVAREETMRRGTNTPRFGEQADYHDRRASLAHKRAKLSYDTHSWWATTKLLTYGVGCTSFVLGPWAFLTALAAALVTIEQYWRDCSEMASGEDYLISECPPRYEMNVPGEVPLSVGTTMGLLLAFRLQTSYKRWWQARELWGQIIQGTRSLLTLIPATDANSHAELMANIVKSDSVEQAQRNARQAERSAAERHRRVAGWCVALSVALEAHLRGGHEGLLLDVADHATRRSAAEADSRASGIEREDSRTPERLEEAEEEPSHAAMRRLLSPSQLWHLAHSKHAPLYALCRLRVAVDACVRASTRRHSDGLERNLFEITEGFLGAITGYTRRAQLGRNSGAIRRASL